MSDLPERVTINLRTEGLDVSDELDELVEHSEATSRSDLVRRLIREASAEIESDTDTE